MSIKLLIPALLCSGIILSSTQAEDSYAVDSVALIETDSAFTLSQLVEQTLEKYPDYASLAVLQQQSEAYYQRGSSWLAGAPSVSLDYKDDLIGSDIGHYEIGGAVELPVWNWGQRQKGLQLAEQLKQRTGFVSKALALQVSGLVRQAVWSLALAELGLNMAEKNFQLTEKLLKTVELRVKVGDLPKSDFLLAESELLQKKTALIRAQSRLNNARNRYILLTQNNKMPQQIDEQQATSKSLPQDHPALLAANALFEQKKARLEWVRAEGSGQSTLAFGGNSEKSSRDESSVDSITFSVSVPFGGAASLAPKIAEAQSEMVAVETEKMHLFRQLTEQLEKAKQALQQEDMQLKLAMQIKQNAQEHLKMANMSFVAGEINLMDFIKIQSRALDAFKNAEESHLRFQRNIALYNQAAGVAL